MDEITTHLRNLTGIDHDGVDCGGMVSTPDGDTMCQLPGGHDGDCGATPRFATGGLVAGRQGGGSILASYMQRLQDPTRWSGYCDGGVLTAAQVEELRRLQT